MRLTDLNPRWVLPENWSRQAPVYYIGLSFDCPCAKCRAPACPTCGHAPDAKRLAVNFWPHIDPQNAAQQFAIPFADRGEHRRTGDAFDTLTLAPSVGFDSIGHWHGNITSGQIVGGI